jgi:hypothetical protein
MDAKVHVIASTSSNVVAGPNDLMTLLRGEKRDVESGVGTRTLFDLGSPTTGETYIMWSIPRPDKALLTIEDAFDEVAGRIRRRNLDLGLIFVYSDVGNEGQDLTPDASPESNLLVIRPLVWFGSAISLSMLEKRSLNERTTDCKRFNGTTLWLTRLQKPLQSIQQYSLLRVLVYIALGAMLTRVYSGIFYMRELQCHARQTSGLEHYFEYSQPNFSLSEWSQEQFQDPTEWAIRFDDQALIPKSAMSKEETKYQDWFRKRYPEQLALVENQAILNETWLYSDQSVVPADGQFHITHCLLAIRRYWLARETGNYVCGFELDYGHIHHCLNALDKVAFPEGPRDVADPTPLRWNTKVCY